MRTSSEWLDLILDPGWAERDAALRSGNPLQFPGYDPDSESVVAASGTCGGFAVEAVSFEFEVFGGSMGIVAGEKIARAFERAIAPRCAVIAVCARGGARMPEGLLALSQMAKTVVARDALASAGLPFIAYFGNPTTGGVYASFGSLADVAWAEPSATIGFAGPRVASRFSGTSLPPSSHTAEFALRHGLVDDVVSPEMLRARICTALDLLTGPDLPAGDAVDPEPSEPTRTAWECVTAARDPKRPTAADLLTRIDPELMELRGDGQGLDDRDVTCALARINGARMLAIALHRTSPKPSGYRKAQRALSIAATLRLPVVALIDTPGADPSSESEGSGIARAIASTFRMMLAHPAPTVSVVTGEGGSGGALAFASTDRLLIMENAFFSVIGPEAAAVILKREDVGDVAEALQLSAFALRRFGIADRIISEPQSGSNIEMADVVAREIRHALSEIDPAQARDARAARWRQAGNQWLRD
ncbi:MAG: carboxyl transferase domain-containing protein [Actinomycetota bacterium]